MSFSFQDEVIDAVFAKAFLPAATEVEGATLYAKPGVTYGPQESFVCVIGAFDGLHIGHRALIDAARADASALNVPLALVTFVPDPSEVLSKRNPERLCSDDDRVRALSLADADLIIAFDFTWQFSRNSYETFTLDVLGSIVKPVSIHVGEDFSFGADGAGSPKDIARLGASHGFSAYGHALIERDGIAVSSTRIRNLIKAGALGEARELLGRCHMMRALVRFEGEQPLLAFDMRSCMPASGAYSCAVVANGVATAAVVLVNADDASAAIVPHTALEPGTERATIVFFSPLLESDDSFARMWVEQDKTAIEGLEVDA